MRRYKKAVLIAGLALFVSAALASPSDAQWRHRGGARIFVGVGGYYGYPFYSAYYSPFWTGWYSPWSGWYSPWWGPYYYPAGYPRQWDRGRSERTVGIRTEISPKETQIYVDGYFSGTASDFDGLFKRLRVPPGQHEIVLYLKGYKTIRQTLDLRSGSDYRVKQKLQPLAAGEQQEAPPSPPPQAERPAAVAPAEGGNPPPVQAPYEGPRRRAPRPPREAGEIQARGFGSLTIRVQPADADVLIDGERWQGPEGAGPMVVQVSEGTHHIEVRKEGYVTFTGDVQVRQGQTSPINVSLPQSR